LGARIAVVAAAGVVFLLLRADRANAVELTPAALSATTVEVTVTSPLPAVEAPVPVATPTPTMALPSRVPITIDAGARHSIAIPPPPVAAPPVALPHDLAHHGSVAPPVADATAVHTAPDARDEPPASSLMPLRDRVPVPRPTHPNVPASTALTGADGGRTQLAATLAVAIALVILFPVGMARARQLKLPMLAFRPLARPG
jgi:hypothetical protein